MHIPTTALTSNSPVDLPATGSVGDDGAADPQNARFAYGRVARQLRERLTAGYYALQPIPSERTLAKTFEVSLVTLRRAVRELIDEGLLVRRGRTLCTTAPEERRDRLWRIGFLSSPYPSATQERLLNGAYAAARGRPFQIRFVPFHGWDDPVILDTLSGFDGAFLYADTPYAIPDALLKRMAESGGRLVALQTDLSLAGIPSIRLLPPSATQAVLDHLEERGHRRVLCVNMQHHDDVIRGRLGQYALWMSRRERAPFVWDEVHCAGIVAGDVSWGGFARYLAGLGFPRLREEAPGECAAPPPRRDALPFTAVFATTVYAAANVMRALREAGLTPGRDVAVAAIDGEGVAELFNPPVTTVDAASPGPFMELALRWMASGGPWTGPLFMHPDRPALSVRASSRRRAP